MGKNSPLTLRTFLKRLLRHIILQQKKKELDWKLPLHFRTLEIIQLSQITALRWRLKRKHKYISSDCKLAYCIFFMYYRLHVTMPNNQIFNKTERILYHHTQLFVKYLYFYQVKYRLTCTCRCP